MSLSNLPPKTTLIWEGEFLHILENNDCLCGIVMAKEEYIPIEHFKSGFKKARDLAIKKRWKAIVFDKSNLNVFHQPSMEWYYTHWKRELVQQGLTKHYKILPEEDWFKASVEAGIAEIKKKNPNFDFTAFEVNYVETVNEAFEQILKN